MPLTSLEDPKFPCKFMKMRKNSNIINQPFMKWSWFVYISHTNKINTMSPKSLQLWDDPNFLQLIYLCNPCQCNKWRRWILLKIHYIARIRI
jgi:hypothetical protein